MSRLQIPFEMLAPYWCWGFLILPVIAFCFRRTLTELPRLHQQLLQSLRMLVLTCLVLAAAELCYLKSTSVVYPVFVIDNSNSIDSNSTAAAMEFIKDATGGFSNDRFAVVSKLPDSTFGSQTNLQAAVENGASVVPAGVVGHIVLLTDGLETEGSLAAAECPFPISPVLLPESRSPEVQLANVTAPDRVDFGETFSFDVELTSNHNTSMQLAVYSDELRIESRTVVVVAGQNSFEFSCNLKETATISARLMPEPNPSEPNPSEPNPSETNPSETAESPADTNFDNNSAATIVNVDGPTRVLLIDRQPDELTDLKFALQQQHIEVEIVPPAGWPRSLVELQKYDTVILSDVAASETTAQQMEVMKTWVRDFGGGLMMLGGENSFGLGGYRGTGLEDILPVTCDFQEKEEEPGLAMMLILDKSSSMEGQKIEFARQAAAGSVELLNERDQVGVIAFDGSPFWISDLVSASRQAQILDRIARIQPGGGTNLYPALQEAFGRLKSASSKLKHVLILSDGNSVPADFEGIIQEMAALRMTVSTVGLGAADNELLSKMSEVGRGRHYECKDPTQLPQIFARETMRMNQPAVREDAILVNQVRTAAAVAKIDFSEAPFLLGYVVTKARPSSEVILVEPDSDDPILCWWNYGLGTTVAFTSDAKSRWSAEWLLWEGYSQFWAQLVRFCRPRIATDEFSLELQRRGRTFIVTMDESSEAQRQSASDRFSVIVVGPDQATSQPKVTLVAPGRHQAVFSAAEPGQYSVSAMRNAPNETGRAVKNRSVIVGYSREHQVSVPDQKLLQAVAETSGGQFSPEPTDVFAPIPGKTTTTSVPLRSNLLIAAMILFVCDVVIRRVLMSRPYLPSSHQI